MQWQACRACEVGFQTPASLRDNPEHQINIEKESIKVIKQVDSEF
jgi:hypothetical protein